MLFFVYRRGYNAANNSALYGRPEIVQVATVEAVSAEEAVELALAEGVSCYRNQHCWAEEAEKANAAAAARSKKVKLQTNVL